MKNMLLSKGFDESDIKLLIDDDTDYDSPNHINVKNALNWLCQERDSDDVIFMHFSGHGTQIPSDDDDEEADNLDEAICLEELFLMADDDLKQFFSQLPEGARATVVMDCCHSGSMLDGTEVMIEGAKDSDSATPHAESDSLLGVLGGSRDVSENRSLPIGTICDVMSQKLGQPVSPTGAGVNGAMAQVFGGSAGKLMMKFALSQLSKQDGGSSNPLVGMLGGLLGSSKPTSTSSSGNPLGSLLGGGQTSSGGNPLSSLMGGGGGQTTSSNPLSSLMGGGGGGQTTSSNPLSSLMGGGGGAQTTSSNPLSSLMGGGGNSGGGAGGMLSSLMGGGGGNTSSTSASQDPMSMLTGMLGGLGLQGQEDSSGAPPYNPQHQPLGKDVCTLITGCQANETSADVRPPGGEAFGALTKTLTDVHESNREASCYDLVRGVRSELSKGGFKQNPCLECSEDASRLPFIC